MEGEEVSLLEAERRGELRKCINTENSNNVSTRRKCIDTENSSNVSTRRKKTAGEWTINLFKFKKQQHKTPKKPPAPQPHQTKPKRKQSLLLRLHPPLRHKGPRDRALIALEKKYGASRLVGKIKNSYDSLHEAVREHNTDQTHAQRKSMAIFLAIPQEALIDEFLSMAQALKWKATTKDTNFRSIVTLAKMTGTSLSIEVKIFAKKLEADAKAVGCNTGQGTSILQLRQLISMNKEHPLLTPVRVAWRLGQRLSDVLQLSSEDVEIYQEFVVITIRRGKTSRRIGRRAIHLPLREVEAELLLATASAPRAQVQWNGMNINLLWLKDLSANERRKMSVAATNLLAQVKTGQRGIRLGGLRTLAAAGLPLQQLLYLSGHTSKKGLLHYLGGGKFLISDARSLASFLEKMERI